MSVIDSENNSSGMEIEFKVGQQIGCFGRILRSLLEIISRLGNLGYLSLSISSITKSSVITKQ